MGELGTMVEYLVEYILVAIITAITPKLITWFFEKISATTINENYYIKFFVSKNECEYSHE